MDIRLTSDQQALIRDAISGGRLLSENDALTQAMELWEERERNRAEILAAVDSAEMQIAHGQGRVITEQSMQELASEIGQRGRLRLAANQHEA